MLASFLVAAGALIVLLLGSIHLLYTFRGPKLTPRDPALQASMREVHPVLTRQTTMWKAWIGFNASHSMGAMLFGLVYGYLALALPQVLFASPFLIAVGVAMLGGFVILGKLYWFSIPFAGVSISLALYLAGIAASRL
jgi:hypothetical protein